MNLWRDLLDTLDKDPWGMSRIVLNKLRMGASRLIESLPPGVVREVIGALFSPGEGGMDVAASPSSGMTPWL